MYAKASEFILSIPAHPCPYAGQRSVTKVILLQIKPSYALFSPTKHTNQIWQNKVCKHNTTCTIMLLHYVHSQRGINNTAWLTYKPQLLYTHFIVQCIHITQLCCKIKCMRQYIHTLCIFIKKHEVFLELLGTNFWKWCPI